MLATNNGLLPQVSWWRTAIGDDERATILDSLARERISMGAVTAELESEICRHLEVPYAVATTSGSVALMMALLALDIGPGDEVIVPTRTFIATAHAASLLGASVVLVDCYADSPNLDVDQIAAHISDRTKAIVPVHLNGRAVDARIFEIARQYGVAVVEDAAQALYSCTPDGYLGTLGAIGCFSFGMVKLASTGQGGALVTRDEGLYQRLLAIRNHGVRDVVSHDYLGVGGNFKLTDILASIGLWQIRRLPEKAAHCNAIYNRYAAALADLSFVDLVPVAVAAGEVAVWTEVTSPQRAAIVAHLAAQGVETRPFLPCVHSAAHFAGGTFPNSERFHAEGFNLPCGPAQPLDNVDRAIAALQTFG
ncbi:MAG: pyridoxal phosphate-dependent aminotransferase [Rhodospirillaceae bacterium]|jgi:dTDP-4-amino-4,6-dideoxygalactose transaminase|nr:pyridoxal phosphate-dependent aminotransferase [Rhodospirillaceae bacterium]MDP6620710.1 DegT/DnrJ/EryC1/StrS family aminotransferase [Alphaproteobacteria bacterium]|tara:strand:+ start:473 stop:1567 length:1095 start_codon:yes stop_codon:yes gene_type:complete